MHRVGEKQQRDGSDEKVTDTIYANLKALGVNVDVVKRCALTTQQLKQFHEGILSAVRRHQNNLASTTC